MPKLVLDEIEYNTEDLSDIGRLRLESLQHVEKRLASLDNEIQVYRTARNAYVESLKVEIEQLSIANESANGA
jgi:hypothetical protein